MDKESLQKLGQVKVLLMLGNRTNQINIALDFGRSQS